MIPQRVTFVPLQAQNIKLYTLWGTKCLVPIGTKLYPHRIFFWLCRKTPWCQFRTCIFLEASTIKMSQYHHQIASRHQGATTSCASKIGRCKGWMKKKMGSRIAKRCARAERQWELEGNRFQMPSYRNIHLHWTGSHPVSFSTPYYLSLSLPLALSGH